MRKNQAIKVMKRAIELVQGGWVQGSLEKDGSFCMFGGIREACNEILDDSSSCYRFAPVFNKRYADDAFAITDWNDKPERTQEQVVRRMQRMLKRIEKGEVRVR